MAPLRRWLLVGIYAAGMAWLEAATVVYLRTLVDRIQPYQPVPLPVDATFGWIEIAREVATLVMLLAVGWLAGRTTAERLGFAMIAFGLWDILYYAFLRTMGPWPHSLLDWDVLFLIPLPWWGPVLAPMLLAGWMILFGALLTLPRPSTGGLPWPAWMWAILGSLLALGVFLWNSLSSLPRCTAAALQSLPRSFLWGPYLAGLVCLAVATWTAARGRASAHAGGDS